MKKTSNILLLLILITQMSFGQVKSKDVNVIQGETFKLSRGTYVSKVIGNDESGTYYIREKKGSILSGAKVFIEKVNPNMVLHNSVEVEIKAEGKKLNFEFAHFMKGKIYVFSSFKNQKLKKNFLFVQSIDNSSLKPNNDRKKIAEIDYKGKWKRNAGYYGDVVSRDKSKLLIYYKLPYNRKENEKFGIHVFNDDMELVWEKKIILPYKDKLFESMDYIIDNLGNAYLLGKIFKDRKEKTEKNKPRYRYHIIRYSSMGTKTDEYPIQINEKFLNTMKLEINDSQDLICAGFYSIVEKRFLGTNEFLLGSFYLKINSETKKIVTKTFDEFDEELLTQHMRRRAKKRAKKKLKKGKTIGLSDFFIKDIIIKKDGGTYLVGEKEYVVVTNHTTTDQSGITSTTTTTTYHYDDILIINISPSGDVIWTERIKKAQQSGTRNYLSYAVINKNDELYFVYNGNVKNLDYKEGEKFKYYSPGRRSIAYLVKINQDGFKKRNILFSKKEIDLYGDPTINYQVTNDLIFLCSRKRKVRFVKLEF